MTILHQNETSQQQTNPSVSITPQSAELLSFNTSRQSADALLRGPKPTVNAFEVTLERLSSAVKMGLYEPGDQLPSERELADIMGVSRATVREAIRLMTEQGILVARRGRTGGTFVSKHPVPETLQNLRTRLSARGTSITGILDHRLVVESGVVELAAQRATDEQKWELQALVNAMEQADNHAEYRKLDTRFHLLIAAATQTNRLSSVVAEIHAELSDLLGASQSYKTQDEN
ncbi:FadR family transcriptional regulator [Thermoleptolyngbya sichuanensis A183]|uniref:FadR family transcriptional regulator n=1 Tax=Thermoleptolyngbya sichuanensis A183 TaxID=2737172 RepID=A0A6M8B900_9CYAN|nr:GntR family transcriptional regulator [Thermoleptolyngbya sichuanensis]QKD83514.1 FadR family transcriptional regulator [Thermoleptolyngbya sichuanensis A183]